ncbi:MAG: hypothetical protein JWQ34_3038 [Mucilaginibacter sp.]|nr:hypothetical protein [Mucilaginibacter sp.]
MGLRIGAGSVAAVTGATVVCIGSKAKALTLKTLCSIFNCSYNDAGMLVLVVGITGFGFIQSRSPLTQTYISPNINIPRNTNISASENQPQRASAAIISWLPNTVAHGKMNTISTSNNKNISAIT